MEQSKVVRISAIIVQLSSTLVILLLLYCVLTARIFLEYFLLIAEFKNLKISNIK